MHAHWLRPTNLVACRSTGRSAQSLPSLLGLAIARASRHLTPSPEDQRF